MTKGRAPDILNPYIAGNPVTGTEMFFGRDDVFAYVRDHLTGKYRDNVIVLYGQRRTGKTSVLYQMSRHLDARYLCIFIDLHGLALQGLGGFLWELANHITRVLRREYHVPSEALPRLDTAAFAADARSQFENEFLPAIWSAIGDRHLLLMLDEAIRLEEQVRAGKMDREIFQYLRHLMQHFERLNFLFSLGSGLEEMAQEYAFLFSVALYKKISFLDRDAAVALITQPARECYEVDADAVRRILDVTSGHAYYTQLLCHSLFAFWQERRVGTISPADVDAVLDEVVERGSAVLKHVWEESSPGEKAVLTGIATAMGDRNRPVRAGEIEAVWTVHDMIVPAGERAKAMQQLIARDVIAGAEEYTFAVDLQRLWVQRHRRPEWVKEEIADALAAWGKETEVTPSTDQRNDALQEGAASRAIETATPGDPAAATSSTGAQGAVSAPRMKARTRPRRRTVIGAAAAAALILVAALLLIHRATTPSPELPSVNTVAFSPNGKLLASGGDDYMIRLWNVASRQQLGAPLAGHTDPVTSVTFSPDGRLLASGSSDNNTRLWNVATRKPLGPPLTGPTNTVYSVAFSPDGKLLASGTGSTIWLWDVKSRKPIGSPLIGHTDTVYSVTFSPDGTLLASGSNDRTVRLWDVRTHKPLGSPLTGHQGYVTSVAFSPDGRVLASAAEDDTVRLWAVKTRKPFGAPLTSTDVPYSVTFSPNGRLLAAGTSGNTIELWNVKTRKPIGSPLTGHTGTVYSVHFSPDGKELVSGSYDGTIRLWDVATRRPLGSPLKSNS